jgi:hypothetical protein
MQVAVRKLIHLIMIAGRLITRFTNIEEATNDI